MPQTVYTQYMTVQGVPGQLHGYADPKHFVSFTCSEDIPCGRAVEVVNGLARLPQGTGQEIPLLAGVSVYTDMMYAGGYKAGEQVLLLRKGTIWVEFTGTGPTEFEVARISHSSTVATNRGKFTDAAADGTATTEVSAEAGRFRSDRGTTSVALVELNLSASAVQ